MRYTLFVAAATMCRYSNADDVTDVFKQAFPAVFSLRSRTQAIELNSQCTSRVRALMIRNAIPVDAIGFRNMSDVDLMRLGMLAAIANISPWLRDSNGSGLIVLDHNGKLTAEHDVGIMESNIMLCIVCTLLGVIGAMHIINMRPP